MLSENTLAPDFALPDADGQIHHLSDFRGQKVVLYFYPRDNTPGCTRQACAFAAAYDGFRQRGVVVIGISKDSAASHQKFAAKYNLPFLLLSDPTTPSWSCTMSGRRKRITARSRWAPSVPPT